MDIEFWETENGKSPPYETLRGLSLEIQRKIDDKLQIIARNGIKCVSIHPWFKYIKTFKFYELKEDRYRIVLLLKISILIVHIFYKKDKKHQQKEFKLADKRLK